MRNQVETNTQGDCHATRPTRHVGAAGPGAADATTVDGSPGTARQHRGTRIDPKVVDPDDVETLQDLVVGALADASKQVTILAQTRLGPLAGGMGDALGIPGF
jgi:DNA-binding protein YbaB